VVRYPYSFGYWGIHLQRLLSGNKTAVVAGSAGKEMHRELSAAFAPNVFPLLATAEDASNIPILKDKLPTAATSIFICTAYECQAPQATVKAALAQL
jgi:uncharacterized protein YyaL (SSP411 family)